MYAIFSTITRCFDSVYVIETVSGPFYFIDDGIFPIAAVSCTLLVSNDLSFWTNRFAHLILFLSSFIWLRVCMRNQPHCRVTLKADHLHPNSDDVLGAWECGVKNTPLPAFLYSILFYCIRMVYNCLINWLEIYVWTKTNGLSLRPYS